MPRRRKYRPINERPGIASYLVWLGGLVCLVSVFYYGWPSLRSRSFPVKWPFASSLSSTSSTPQPAIQNRGRQAPSALPNRAPQPKETNRFQALELTFSTSMTPGFAPRPPASDFEIQVALVRRGLSPGSIDGVAGSQTRAAIRAWQEQSSLPVTGLLDDSNRARLLLAAPPLVDYTVTDEDIARLRPISPSWLGKSFQDRLDYETILELVAEKGKAYPNYIRNLNPNVDWNRIRAGTQIKLPYAAYPEITTKAAFVRIFLSDRVLRAYDTRSNVLAHFPCSIAQQIHKRPLGELHVEIIIQDPNYTFNPEIFPESEEGRQLGRKLVIPPGPNNPVGLAWIGLDRPGYGIHGTPEPEKVGRTESHGCFRLSNWNAAYLAQLAWISMPVYVEP